MSPGRIRSLFHELRSCTWLIACTIMQEIFFFSFQYGTLMGLFLMTHSILYSESRSILAAAIDELQLVLSELQIV